MSVLSTSKAFIWRGKQDKKCKHYHTLTQLNLKLIRLTVSLTTLTQPKRCATLLLSTLQILDPTPISEARFSLRSWHKKPRTKKCSLHQTISRWGSLSIKTPFHSNSSQTDRASLLLRMSDQATLILNKRLSKKKSHMRPRQKTLNSKEHSLNSSRCKKTAHLTSVLQKWTFSSNELARFWLNSRSLMIISTSMGKTSLMRWLMKVTPYPSNFAINKWKTYSRGQLWPMDMQEPMNSLVTWSWPSLPPRQSVPTLKCFSYRTC